MFLFKKKFLIVVGLVFAVVFVSGLFVSFYVKFAGSDCIVKDIGDLPFKADAVLILGAKVYPETGKMSDVLKDRVDTGFDVYSAGKVEKIIVSGDNGQEEYDEVNVMKNYLLEKGISSEDLFMDHAGFDTYDSVYRTKNIFGVDSLVIVTQEFHLPRALYISDALEIKSCGVIADRRKYRSAVRNDFREFLARYKAFFDVNLGTKSKYLGDKIDIGGNGRVTWD